MNTLQQEIHARAADRVDAMKKLRARGLPGFVAGMADSHVPHPLGPPTVSGTDITVDMMLQQPTRVTRMIMDLSLQRFIGDIIFASAGGVTGGAVVYDQATLNELYTDRDVQKVEPGSEFPIVTSERTEPKVATVDKWGGKVFITDEARDRNNAAGFTNQVRQLTNTIVRKLNQAAVAELEAELGNFASQTIVGVDWSTVVTGGSSQSNYTLWPAYDFTKAQQKADEQELGVTVDTWIMNPQEYWRLFAVYGGDLNQLLASMGQSVFSSNRVAAGTAYALARTQAGEMRVEQPLATETWRDPNGKQQTWLQSSVRPVHYVTNPYAVFKFTGLAG